MKICFICPEYPEGPHGGIGSMVQILSRELVKLGHEIRVIGVYPNHYPAPFYECDQGVHVWRLREHKSKFGWIFQYIRQFCIIYKWARNKEIEIVEAPDSRGWIAFWPKLIIPVILRAHGSNTYFSKILGTRLNWITSTLEKRSYKRADFLAAVSNYTGTKTKQILCLNKDFTVIYNGIEIPNIPDEIAREPNSIIFSGSLTYKKGIYQLIEGVLMLLKKNQNITLKIFGKDTIDKNGISVKSNILKMIPEELKSNFIFIGHVSRTVLFEEYQKCQLAIFPSFAEAFAIAPLESMACRCPTIYTKLGSGSEVIVDGIDGLLIDPFKPTEIADAIDRILQDQNFASNLGKAGRKRIEEDFSKEMLAQKTLKFYQSCIKEFHKRKQF